jgi:hypothetical protein
MSRKRYEEEIEEILKRLDIPSEPPPRRARGKPRRSSGDAKEMLGRLLSGFQTGHLLLISLVILLGTFLLPLPGRRYLAILGILLFAVAMVLSMMEKRQPRHEIRWRGRVIQYDNGRGWQSWWRRFLGRR